MAQWITGWPDDRFEIWHRREQTLGLGQSGILGENGRPTGCLSSHVEPVRLRTSPLGSVDMCSVWGSRTGVKQYFAQRANAQDKALMLQRRAQVHIIQDESP